MNADINCSDRNHRTMLHWACRFDNVVLVKKLMKWKISYAMTDIEQKSALDIAKKYNNEDCI